MQSLRLFVPLTLALALSAGAAYAAPTMHKSSIPAPSSCATDVPQSLSPTVSDSDDDHSSPNDPQSVNDNAYCNGTALYHMRSTSQDWGMQSQTSVRVAPMAMY